MTPPSVSLQVMYAEVPIAFVGSLAYAEDDSKHIVGIKTAYQQQGSLGGWAVAGAYCCHVLECDTEVGDNNTIYGMHGSLNTSRTIMHRSATPQF